MIVLVMGVAGAGKTAVGHALAEQLGWRFADQSPANVAKMRAGVALTDNDRESRLQIFADLKLDWKKLF